MRHSECKAFDAVTRNDLIEKKVWASLRIFMSLKDDDWLML